MLHVEPLNFVDVSFRAVNHLRFEGPAESVDGAAVYCIQTTDLL